MQLITNQSINQSIIVNKFPVVTGCGDMRLKATVDYRYYVYERYYICSQIIILES